MVHLYNTWWAQEGWQHTQIWQEKCFIGVNVLTTSSTTRNTPHPRGHKWFFAQHTFPIFSTIALNYEVLLKMYQNYLRCSCDIYWCDRLKRVLFCKSFDKQNNHSRAHWGSGWPPCDFSWPWGHLWICHRCCKCMTFPRPWQRAPEWLVPRTAGLQLVAVRGQSLSPVFLRNVTI